MMKDSNILNYIKDVITNRPTDWLGLTTHRLDIYEEKFAKIQFLEQFEELYKANNAETSALSELPTAYDYIRLGHPLSCILEWGIAKKHHLDAESVISFSSQTIPLLAILRTNLLQNKKTQVCYQGGLPQNFDSDLIEHVYGYSFELKQVNSAEELSAFEGSTVFISSEGLIGSLTLNDSIDFHIHLHGSLGSVLIVNGEKNEKYISDIQHVRRRETIAMTPSNSLAALQAFVNQIEVEVSDSNLDANKASVQDSIKKVTGTDLTPYVGSSGLSVQYAIMMGLIHDAIKNHPGKPIKFLVPPNCYGGTNDQARRVAATLDQVEVVDLPVDGDNDMVSSIDRLLQEIAAQDAIPYIIAEIPTNPRVEVPDLEALKSALSRKRTTSRGNTAIDPVFILDQTFCPNYQFLGEGEILSTVRTISYASGSKFPSGGKCTAGYVVGNNMTAGLMEKIGRHLELCDNEATSQQYQILAHQMPSMNQRIADAYDNTREFVDFINDTLPEAKMNFVSEELAAQGFTPSVFSLDLPTRGETDEERESYKRQLNLKLIHMMITQIPSESKFCVSYGQLKGCYWTVPATSTQGTTKEGDKDYIVRASLSPDLDLKRHKEVFLEFIKEL